MKEKTLSGIGKGILLAAVASILAIVLAYAFALFIDFFGDLGYCTRDYDFSSCIGNFVRYQVDAVSGGCFVNHVDVKGLPPTSETFDVLIDVYAVNTNMSKDRIEEIFFSVNRIWNAYNVNFVMRDISFVKNESLKEVPKQCPDMKKVAESVVKDLYDDSIIDVIIFPFKDEGGAARVEFECSEQKLRVNLAVQSTKSKNITWDLAHELGHLLDLGDKALYSGEMNLMTHLGCIKDRYYPTILNQAQVDSVVRSAKDFVSLQRTKE